MLRSRSRVTNAAAVRIAVVAALLLRAAPLAFAAPPSNPVATPPPKDARTLTREAKAAFDAGRFAEAADLLARAYALEPSTTLLYNMGRAYQQAGDKARAVQAYERYLEVEKFPPDEGAVRQTIEQLRREIERESALSNQAVAERERADREAAEREKAQREKAEAEERAKHKPSAVPWIVAGVGAGGLVVAIVLGAVANGAHAGAVEDPDLASAMAKQDRALAFALGANVAFAVGGALALTGVIWGIFDVRASLRRVSVGVGPASVALKLTF